MYYNEKKDTEYKDDESWKEYYRQQKEEKYREAKNKIVSTTLHDVKHARSWFILSIIALVIIFLASVIFSILISHFVISGWMLIFIIAAIVNYKKYKKVEYLYEVKQTDDWDEYIEDMIDYD